MDSPTSICLDEKLNASTHALGCVLSLLGIAVFFVYPREPLNLVEIIAYGVFGASLLMVYFTSMMYHLSLDLKKQLFWKRLDHIAIFYLIAGTYTPFCLLAIPSPETYQLLTWIWLIALFGSLAKWFLAGRFRWLSTLFYLLLGWMVLLEWNMFQTHMPSHLVPWIVAGGLFYSTGTIFYIWERLPFNHAIWHLFVLAGSACHYLAVFFTIKS